MNKKHDEIKDRAEYLVKNFSDKDGNGSVITTCPEQKCHWPSCQCVTSVTTTAPKP